MSPSLALLAPSLHVTRTPEGLVLEPREPLPAPAPTLCDLLARGAHAHPERALLAERDASGAWQRYSWSEVQRAVERVAGALLERGAGPTAPVAVLSDNSVAHAVVALAALHAGAPVSPLSSAYSLLSSTHGRLRQLDALLGPAVYFVESRGPFARALEALGARDAQVLDAQDLWRAAASSPVPRAASVGPDAVAKVLFTSGSTGTPKGVRNTHAMLCSNQESLRACWPFLASAPPTLVDWLPWSHTFGSNHNFNMVLRNGGTLYVDRGRPAPGLLSTTLTNLASVGPDLWFNVPRGFDQAVDALERDEGLAREVFRNLKLLFYAGAALAPSTRTRLERVAERAGNSQVFFTSGWGSTETSPLATSAHFATPTAGVLGVPVPGTSLKLVRAGDRYELRVKGPHVAAGYWRRGGGSEPVPLDEEGFWATGDAGRLVDEARPEAGVTFVGRLSENFKLSSGTWVHVGSVRLALVDACAPLLADAVLAGHDGEALGALLVLSPTGSAGLTEEALRERLEAALRAYNAAHPSSSERVERALVLARPLSLDEGESTDKGYTNQRRVLETRAEEARRLFEGPAGERVLR